MPLDPIFANATHIQNTPVLVGGTPAAGAGLVYNTTTGKWEYAVTVANVPQLAVVSNIPLGAVAYGSLGTNAVHVAGTEYYSEFPLPFGKTCTGIKILQGATVGTDNLIGAIADSTGVVLATSLLTGIIEAGADTFLTCAFTAPIFLPAGRYWAIVQCNGTTAKTRRIAASTYPNLAGSATGTFGTIANITPPTTFTADMGPIVELY